jgi:hypothetical protein
LSYMHLIVRVGRFTNYYSGTKNENTHHWWRRIYR